MSESKESVINGHHNGQSNCSTHLKYKALEIPQTLQKDFVYPDLPSKCTWISDKEEQPPTVHTVRPL